MLRKLFAAMGLVALLAPRRLVDFWESVAFENAADVSRRGWTIPLARLEGLVFLGIVAQDEDATALSKLLAVFGVPTLLAPEQYLRTGLGLAYENAEDIEVKSWVVPATRLIGLVYLLGGVSGLRKSGSDDETA